MRVLREREFTSGGLGGLELAARAWLPDGHVRSVVVLAHGLGEHSGRYAALAADLVARGHALYAVDHRGHGRSPGPRANIERFDHLVSDFSAFVGRAARQHFETPLVLLGHSLGGAVAFAAALRLQGSLRGLMLSAPALAPSEPVSAARRFVARTLASVAPNTGLLRLPPAAVSRDPAVVRAYENDPLVFHGSIPARTLVELLDAMEKLPSQAAELRLPVLALHGTADSLVPVDGVRPFYQALDVRRRTVRYYHDFRHEVFNEPDRAQVVADALDWLEHLT